MPNNYPTLTRHLLLYCLLLPLPGIGQATLSGTVFEDVNGNGALDAGEKGIAGVAVSDQLQVVLTDSRGNYQLSQSGGYGIIMISVPDGYRPKDSFWQASAGSNTIHFSLLKTKPVTEFSFLHASDTHVSEKSVDRMEKMRAAIEEASPDLVLITGDLVRDALRVPEQEATRYYQLFKKEIAPIQPPVWCVPGNHEIFGIERHLSLVSPQHPLYGRKMYRHHFGPDYYSFNFGGIHFIGLNSLEFEDLWYYGRIDSVQLQWLQNDLANIPANTPVVTFQHVPFFSGGLSLSPFEEEGLGRSLETEHGRKQYRHVVSNAQEIMEIMKGRNYPLALAGHFHARQTLSFEGTQTRFEQTAAVVAPSEEGAFTIPSGVTLYRVKDGKIDAGRFIPLDH